MESDRQGWREPEPEEPSEPADAAESREEGLEADARLRDLRSAHPRFVQRRGRYRPWYARQEGPFSRLPNDG